MGNQYKTLLQKTPIAIIGMASLFPESRNLREFWRNILNKVNCIIDVPPDRWSIDDLYDPDPSAVDKTYCKRGGFIPDVDFDPIEFGLPPNILEVTDSSQLLSLLVARDLLQDCGYEDGNFDRKNTGVILGVGGGQKLISPLVSRLQGHIWKKVLKSSGVGDDDINVLIEKMKKAYIPWEENSFPGMLGNVIAGRVANRLDLGGTNCVVDAACAGSLAAMKMAVNDLLEHKANMMITGGVDTDNSPFMYLNFSKTPAFTSDAVPKPFDEKSKGIVIGEGVGMLMLKRLQDAERDNDRIYAVITGIGSSSDGRFKSIYAPRAAGQTTAINRAYQDAGIAHNAVGLIEAHGTGTKAGDAAEFEGLKAAFDNEGHEVEHIALGSVKSQIGHTKTAAGAAGLIKTALALYHKVLPPTLNVERPNPKMHIKQSSFYINSETRPWLNPKGGPRIAGVSAFGFGGSNYHFVLQEYEREPTAGYRLHAIARPFVLHAKTVGQLNEKCADWLTVLQSDTAEMEYFNFVQQAQNPGIPQSHARIGFVAEDRAQVIERLHSAHQSFDRETGNAAWTDLQGVRFRQQGFGPETKLVALFSGQGSQYLNMCNELLLNFPPMRDAFAEMGQLSLGDSTHLCNAVYPQPAFDEATQEENEERLKLTQFIQPSVGCISVGLFRLLTSIGFKADFTAGHSFGELTALWAAGVIDDENYFSLSRSRSMAMAAPPPDSDYDTGAMLAVMGDVDSIEEHIKKFENVSVANYNSPKQVVIAGSKESIIAAQSELKESGFSTVKLPVSAAFHSPLVDYAHKPFSDAIDAVSFNKPKIAVFSNVTTKQYPKTPKAIKESFKKNMLTSVRFTEEIRNIADKGGTIFVEFGPKNVLTRLVDAILEDVPHLAIALNSTPKKDSDYLYRHALMQLKVAGVDISLKDIYQPDIEKPQAKKAGMSIKLNGSNYVSEATQQAFTDALNDGHKLKVLQAAQSPLAITAPVAPAEPVVAADRPAPAAVTQAPVQPVVTQAAMPHAEWLKSQSETLKTHGLYLQNQQEYAQGFFQLMGNIVKKYGAKNQPVPDSITQGVSDFQSYQQDTLNVHQQYLSHQLMFNQSAHQLYSGQAPTVAPVVSSPEHVAAAVPAVPAAIVAPAAVATEQPPALSPSPAPVAEVKAAPAVVSTGLDAAVIKQAMLEIVHDKTGYPVEMLDLGMDMEADLGIDSIKRVEILGAMTSKFPELPELDQNALAEMRTLGEIVAYVETQAPASAPAVASAVTPAASGLDAAAIKQGMLEIVHDKTGYPVEMLDLSMDMEADLGIDSIKRVEILGAMTSKFPELPELDQNALAEMRTLSEIVAYVETQAPASAPAVASAVAPAASGLDAAAIKQGMLEIVHDKTGYPVEMLDLSMDMEADLGIDSIKRVEILGAMTSKFPELPELDQNALAEMRTLGEIVAYVEEASGQTALQAENASLALTVTSSMVKKKRLTQPDQLSAERAGRGRSCLIIDNGTQLTYQLAEILLDLGWQVKVLCLPESLTPASSFLPEGAVSVQLKNATEADLQAAIGDDPVHGFIHLSPTANKEIPLTEFSRDEEARLKIAFFAAKHLHKHLSAPPATGRNFFVAVTCMDGEMGTAANSRFDVVQGGYNGLLKTLNLEWSSVFCRAIDLSPDFSAQESALAIVDELFDADLTLAEVGCSAAGRITLAADIRTESLPVDSHKKIPAESVFLVSGGAKGVTAACIIKLAKDFHCRFILLGRAVYNEGAEPEWAKECSDEAELKQKIMQDFLSRGEKPTPKGVNQALRAIKSDREIRRTLADIHQAGGQAEYISADVTQIEGMKEKLAPAITRLGKITGLIHGAGVLADKPIQKKTEADFDSVIATKIHGLQAMLSVVKTSELEYLVLFSSAAGFYGNTGQSDYAIANDILNKVAYQFRYVYPECHVVAFNWGPWDGGMVTVELKRYFKQRNVEIIPLAEGAAIFVGEMHPSREQTIQLLVGSSMRAETDHNAALQVLNISRKLLLQDNAFLQDHVIGDNAVLPSAAALAWMVDSCEKTHPGLGFNRCENFQVLKGIVFDGSQADDYQLEIKQISTEGNDDGVQCQLTVSSRQSGNKQPVWHYKADIIVNKLAAQAPMYQAMDLQENSAAQDGAVLYTNGTLFHGPRFQSVRKVINHSEKKLTLICHLDKVSVADQGQFLMGSTNLFATDLMFQAMLVWVRLQRNMGSLPLKFASMEQYCAVPMHTDFYVSVDVEAETETSLTATVYLHDAAGLIYAQASGAEVTVSASLNSLFIKKLTLAV
jgi:acyl transferase domain-containing protein